MKNFRQGKIDNSGLNQIFGSSAEDWDKEFWREYRWAYRRHMETVDRELGVMLKGLKDAGLEDNTVIVFTSDHGDHDGAHQLTMKRSFYEESANVPLIVSWKGHCTPGTVDSTTLVVNGLDVIPTLCDIADIKAPEQLRGVSFLSAAQGRPLDRDFIVVQNNTGRMLRTAQYKYAVYYRNGQSEEQLFDMYSDRLEMNNLAKKASHSQIIENYRELLRAWTIENKDTKGKKYLSALTD